MKNQSITRRWLTNSVGSTAAILLAVVIIGAFAVRSYYYSSVKQLLTSTMNGISGSLSRRVGATQTLSERIAEMVEGFEGRDRMELMAIDGKGKVSLTSSGFAPSDADMPDYTAAMADSTDTGYFTGYAGGEKIMAMTYIISDTKSEYSALRLSASITAVDRQIFTLTMSIFAACFIILCLVLFSGMYFIKSIVIPTRKIGEAAGKIAKGDFAVRVSHDRRDELGELCDTINHMADELSATEQLKNEFISSVSHELRTPLTAIKGWGETLADVNDPETVKKGIRVINGETERLSKMVEELLDFSRIQNGRMQLNIEPMDALTELEEVVLIYEEKARRENIRIEFDEPEYLPMINGDRNRIRQVFINIIDNAVKYSNEGGGKITVKAAQDGDRALFTIEDTGVGISAADLPRVKEKFFKANHSRRGSGIGLGVADEIVKLHGGELSIDSVEGVGTTVTISLPVYKKKGHKKVNE